MIRGRTVWAWARSILTLGYALFCIFTIMLLSEREYEWMIEDPYQDPRDKMTICTIPASTDDISDVTAPFCFILVLVLLIPGLVRLVMKRRLGPSLVLGLALLAFWAWRFWGRMLFCK
jgi:hypothetical protein